jgi:uncharacterized protein YecE (DUF72 family)
VTIRTGIGGWTFEPWRGVFYPKGLAHARELEFASRALTTIEVNGTFYGSMSPATYAKWHSETPDDFVFSLKAPRFAVNRRELAGAGDSIVRFFASGVDELGDKLGPILWQFAATKQFDADDFGKFIRLLPSGYRHALEPRHESFRDPAFVAMARDAGAAIVFADSYTHPMFDEATADFAYARLQNGDGDESLGYLPAALDGWAEHARQWARQGTGGDRDVFVYFISGGKVRAPAAAQALLDRLR